MKVEVRVTKSFKKASKSLIKKYDSFLNDLEKLEKELFENPKLGTPLGKNAYKIRLKIESKKKGKSGGARVISYLELIGILEVEQQIIVNLITVYDKSEKATITEIELKNLIENIEI